MIFVNAFAREEGWEPFPLLCRDGADTIPNRREVKQRIGRWRSRAFFNAALKAFGVETAYGIEEQLLKSSDQQFPFERPRLFDRLREGEPSLHSSYDFSATQSKTASFWINEAIQTKPELQEVLDDPLWTLLDPSPIDRLHTVRLYIESMKRTEKQSCKVSSPGFQVPIDEYYGDRSVWIPVGHEVTSRSNIENAVSLLRMSEASCDIDQYYLSFLESLRRCQELERNGFDAAISGCQEHIRTCFGFIYFGYPVSNLLLRERFDYLKTGYLKGLTELGLNSLSLN